MKEKRISKAHTRSKNPFIKTEYYSQKGVQGFAGMLAYID